MRAIRAFTLVELLVVIAIVALLIGILMPALSSARRAGQRVACLSNMRQMEIAHQGYLVDSDGVMLGTGHSGPGTSWTDTLRRYSGSLLLRSPVDTSPHFEGGTPIGGRFRQTSYTLNFFLAPDSPMGYQRIEQVPRVSATAHYAIAVYEGANAVSDHYHPHLWFSPLQDLRPEKAAMELQTNAHGGAVGAWGAVGNYGFLDGHAEVQRFDAMYFDQTINRFDPAVAP